MAVSTVGSGQDYATLTLWEDAKDGLSQDDTGQLVDTGERTEADFTFDGKTSSFDWILVATGSGKHDGTHDSGAWISNSGTGHIITISDDNVDIEDVEIRLETAIVANSNECIRVGSNNTAALTNIRRCILRMDAKGQNDCDGIYISDNGNIVVENCAIYTFSRAGIHLQQFSGSDDITVKVRNCTVDDCGEAGEDRSASFAWENSSGTQSFETKNCLSLRAESTTADWFDNDGDNTFTGDYNGTGQTSSSEMPGGNSVANLTSANEVTTLGSDYHVQDTDAGSFDTGLGPGSDADIPTDDIVGNVRSGSTCDISCFEFQDLGGDLSVNVNSAGVTTDPITKELDDLGVVAADCTLPEDKVI